MVAINRILIVLDVFEDYRDDEDHIPIEVDKALQFTSPSDEAEIILVGCGFEEYLHEGYFNFAMDAIEQRKAYVEKLEARLQAVADGIKAKGFKVTTKVHWTFPRFEQVAQEAEDHNVDLVVQHVNPHTEMEHPSLSHDSWQLVKYCKRPLLLIKAGEWQANPVIIAAVDPVHRHHKPMLLDNTILDYSIESAAQLEGEVHVLHAYTESARPFAKPGSIKAQHEEAMNDLLKDYDFDADHVHMIDDKPVFALLKAKERLNSDVIVMGAISRSRFSDAVVGNTAERVIDYLKSDILVLKPNQK